MYEHTQNVKEEIKTIKRKQTVILKMKTKQLELLILRSRKKRMKINRALACSMG